MATYYLHLISSYEALRLTVFLPENFTVWFFPLFRNEQEKLGYQGVEG
jgi:hypothetical protein